MSKTFNKEKCDQRRRQAALRYGIDSAPVKFLSGASDGAPVEYRNYGGKLPETDAEALAMINAMLPEGADALTLADVYIHYVEAANNSFIAHRYAFISRDSLRNIARDGAAGAAFMNSHRTGGLSTDAEFPFGKTFAGQYQEGRDAEGSAVQRTMLGVYMLRGIKPNGDSAPSTDDLDRKIRGGTLFDVSVGLYGGARICDVCDGDVSDYDACPHLPGTYYAMDEDEIAAQKSRGVPDGKASYTIKGASLGEVSGVFDGAVRGAGFRKAVSLANSLSSSDLRLAREVYGGLNLKEEPDGQGSLLERVSEAVADGFRRAFGGKPPTPPPALEAGGLPGGDAAEDDNDMSDKTNNEEVERLRKDSEELAKMKAKERQAGAEKFATEQVTKHKRLLPFGKDKLQTIYLRLADGDQSLAAGEESGVKLLMDMFSALPGHNLTTELAAGQLPDGATVLDNESDPDKALVKQGQTSIRAFAERANNAGASRRQ